MPLRSKSGESLRSGDAEAEGRLAGKPGDQERVAVVDIGSNSIRLVVFDGCTRAPTPLFNEKVLCGLGRGLAGSGRLNEDGVALALPNLLRFARLARAMGVEKLDFIATAAVREAVNGPDFVAEIERSCGEPVRVISGEEEARLSGCGVISGSPDAEGIMGDLGGGSLELVELRRGRLGRSVTLPLGPLRLIESCRNDRGAAHKLIDSELRAVDWLRESSGLSFFPVGGTWRNLAKIHIEQTHYPLHVIHGYRLSRESATDLTRLIALLGPASLLGIKSVSRRRLETLPFGSVLLWRIMKHMNCRDLVFSAFGLREGLLYDQLSEAEKAKDPLIAMARDWAERDSRFLPQGDQLVAWTAPLFSRETPQERRLREAACHLSDLAWRDHPDYRADQAFNRVLHYPFAGIDHPDRLFLAYTQLIRYGGAVEGGMVRAAMNLLTPAAEIRARILGLALRLAYRLSGGTPGLIGDSALDYSHGEGRLELVLPPDGSVPLGEAVEKRVEALRSALFEKPALSVA